MTNRLAIILALALVGAVLADVVFFGGANLLFLGKKLFFLMDWLAFWH
jgi:hypothetical protein